jgi:hypothetical protein
MAGKSSETVQIKFTVDRETADVLKVEALGRGCSIGQYVEELVKGSPRRFVLERQSQGHGDVEA